MPGLTNQGAMALSFPSDVLSVNNPRHLVARADFTLAAWNTVATHEVFTVTGPILFWWWATCAQDVTSATGNGLIQIGREGATDDFLPAYSADLILEGMISNATVMDFGLGPEAAANIFAPVDGLVMSGLDIGYEVTVEALSGGLLDFHIVWQPLAAGAVVLAGNGGAL